MRKNNLQKNMIICYLRDKGLLYDERTHTNRSYSLGDLARLFTMSKAGICKVVERNWAMYIKLSEDGSLTQYLLPYTIDNNKK